MKRCLCLFLCVVSVLVFSAVFAWADEAEASVEPVAEGGIDPISGECGETLTWAITQNEEFTELMISGSGVMDDYTAEAPAPWGYCSADIDRITMEEGITEVGSNAFAGCVNPELILAGTLTSLHTDAFSGDFSSSCVYYNGTRTKWADVTNHEQLLSVGSFVFNYYTVTLDPNGGACEVETKDLFRQTVNGLPTPVWEGHTFIGWFTAAKSGENIRELAPTEDITVYAHWEDQPETLSGTVTETISWSLDIDTGVLTLTGTGAMPDYTDETATPWWAARSYVGNIVIGEGITNVGSHAFADMQGEYVKAMGAVTLPEGLASVGSYAFADSGFCEVAFPDSLTAIGAHAFENNRLTALSLPEGTESIGEYAFAYGSLMDEVTLPGNLKELGGYAFTGCETLFSVTVSEGITALPEGCFALCEWLQSLALPSSIETLGENAFMGTNDRSFRFELSERTFTVTVTPSKEKSFVAWTVTDGKDIYTNEELARGGVPAAMTAVWEDIPAEEPISFTDVKDTDWFYSYVLYCAEKDIMNGVGSGCFAPYRSATRGQVVTVLYRMAGEPAYGGTVDFDDVTNPTAYYYDAVRWAAEVGITTGYPNGRFYPNASVSRQEFVTFLYRYAKYAGIISNDWESDLYSLDFPDAEDVAAWAKAATVWSVENGIQTGTLEGGKTYLKPEASVIRAQLATYLARFDVSYYRIWLTDFNAAFENAPVSEFLSRFGEPAEKVYAESCLCIGGFDGVWGCDIHGVPVTVYTLKYDEETEIFLYLEMAE